ncbi:MAG: cytochrome c biogenesis protein ResB, partial [bacterium]|nr:cytochrome c biogenesis protein ResB [bacterium]
MKVFLKKFWAVLTSLELAVILIMILAVFQIFGSIVAQNMDYEYYEKAWSKETYEIIKGIGLLNVFSSPLFVIPAVLLGINLGACALDIVARFFYKKSTHRDFVSALYHLSLFAMFAGFFSTFLISYGDTVTLNPGEETTITRKWSDTNWKRFGTRFGWYVPPDTETDFKIRLESFDTYNVEMGGELFVEDWISSLQVIEDGKVVEEKAIEVNDPLVYGGLKFYQIMYEQTIAFEVDGEAVEGMSYAPLMLGEESLQVRPIRHGILLEDDGTEGVVEPYLDLKPFHGEGKTFRLDKGVTKDVLGHSVKFVDFTEASVLSYKRDPAVKYLWVLWMVFTGLIAIRIYFQEPYRL